MDVKIFPSSLTGFLKSPASKSFAMRAILAACFSCGVSRVKNVEFCEDVKAMVFAMKSLGVKIKIENKDLIIFGGLKEDFSKNIIINCFESGFVFRVLSFLVGTFFSNVKLKVADCLLKRPLICKIKFNGKEFNYVKSNKNLFYFKGNLHFGKYEILDCKSSQFLTGLFFCLPILKKDSEIILKTKLSSRPYVNMTIRVLKNFGILIKKTNKGFKIPGNQKYLATCYEVEGDFAQAAFFQILGVLWPIGISGLNKHSIQGERKILKIVRHCGARVKWKKNDVFIFPNLRKKLKPFKVCVKDFLDLAPVLAILACVCTGISKIYGVKNLAFKESNRIDSILSLVNSLGGKAFVVGDIIKIVGVRKLKGGFVQNFSDHRMVMAAFIASCFCENFVFVPNVEVVFKSNVNFFKDFTFLGGSFSGFCLE